MGVGDYDDPDSVGAPAGGRPAPQHRSDLHTLEMLGSLALSWIDFDIAPRVMLSNELIILWANAAARSTLARRRDVENRAGIFSTVNPAHQQSFQDFIVNGGAATTSWSVPRADGDGRLVVRTQRIDWSEDGLFGVTFFGSGSEFRPHFVGLDTVFGLTKSETRVLTDILSGHEADRIARMHGVSVETTRSHIRSIYMKLGVKSREALFHKVQPFRL